MRLAAVGCTENDVDVRIAANPIGINTDGAVGYPGDLSSNINTTRGCLITAYTDAGGRKVPRIRVLLENHQVCAEHTIQYFFSPCQSTVLASVLVVLGLLSLR